MTCREKLSIDKPWKIRPRCLGGCVGCPSDYGYLDDPEDHIDCEKCWDRDIPGTNKIISGSGSKLIYIRVPYDNVEQNHYGYIIKFDNVTAIKDFIYDLERLVNKMEDADTFLDILNVIS